MTSAAPLSEQRSNTQLGPGLLEGAYEGCLAHELRKQGLRVDCQVLLPVKYDGVLIDIGYRIDMLVEDLVIVELKATEKIHPLHLAQVLSYLKMSGKHVGLLLNFNVCHMKDGVRRIVNRFAGVRTPLRSSAYPAVIIDL
jgi:GxxExxY protein